MSAPAAPGSVAFDNIGLLVTNDPALGAGLLGCRKGSALVAVDGRVAWVGDAGEVPEGTADSRVDVGGRAVVPGFVDSHTHLVFAGDRSAEFAARLAGSAYEAGGILTTVSATRAASDEALDATVARLAAEALRTGTTTLECKSGYGLTTRDEERSLRIAKQHTEETTFLGAHTVPAEFAGRGDDYVALVCSTMLEACAPHARWVDVFCEAGAFDADQAAEVLRAGARRSLLGRVHANQLGPGPGVQVAVEAGAASADHCTFLADADVDALSASGTVATLLPGAEFSTRSPYANGRRLFDAGATVALASDCNPGTSYTTSIPWCVALATREMGMTVDEAVWAATLGGARALRRDDVGHLGVGAKADLVVLDAPSHVFLAYRPGVQLVAGVWRQGELAWAPSPTTWDSLHAKSV
jgi:imidazolonepropionase